MQKVKLIFANVESELEVGHSIQGRGFTLLFDSQNNLILESTAAEIEIHKIDGSTQKVNPGNSIILDEGDYWKLTAPFGELEYKIIEFI